MKAKKKTYASKTAVERRNDDGSKELRYREGDLLYLDKYYGSITFTGQEFVFFKGKLIWFMAYRGSLVESFEMLSKQCYAFLKSCLRKLPLEFPVRGPKDSKKGNFKYFNNYKGDLDDFVGVETIFWKDEVIYSCNYFGGAGKLKKKNVVL